MPADTSLVFKDSNKNKFATTANPAKTVYEKNVGSKICMALVYTYDVNLGTSKECHTWSKGADQKNPTDDCLNDLES